MEYKPVRKTKQILIIAITNSRTVSVHAPEKNERLLVVYENGTNLGRYNFRSTPSAYLCLHETYKTWS